MGARARKSVCCTAGGGERNSITSLNSSANSGSRTLYHDQVEGKAVGAVFGLTCSKYQSGEIDCSGRISRCGDEMMPVMLYEAAQSMLVRSTRWSWLKAWAMHRIWVDGTEFRRTREQAAAAA